MLPTKVVVHLKKDGEKKVDNFKKGAKYVEKVPILSIILVHCRILKFKVSAFDWYKKKWTKKS